MTTVQDILASQQSIESCLSSRMEKFEKDLRSATSITSLEDISIEFKTFRELVWSTIKCLRTQVQTLALQMDELDNYNRRNALLFSGIPEAQNEVCSGVILAVINSLGNLEDVNSGSFQQCHRLGTKKPSGCRPILVRFNNISIRNAVWNNKKSLKASQTVIREFLTRPRQAIFAAARKHFGTNNCWTRDGSIYVNPPNAERSRIGSLEDLKLLMAKHPAVSTPSTNTTTTTMSQQRTASKVATSVVVPDPARTPVSTASAAAAVAPMAAPVAAAVVVSASAAAAPVSAATAPATAAAAPVRQPSSRKTTLPNRLVNK